MEDDEVELNLPGLPSMQRSRHEMRGQNSPESGHAEAGAADPLHDPEAAALYLVEVMLPAMRRELGGCSWRAPEGEGELIIGPGERRTDEPSYKLA